MLIIKDAASARVCTTAPMHESAIGLWCKVGVEGGAEATARLPGPMGLPVGP